MAEIRQVSRALGPGEIAELVKNSLRPVILEIGCNDGTDSWRIFNGVPRVNMYCFECDPRPVQRFVERFGLTGDTVELLSTNRRLELIRQAVGKVDGDADFYQSGGTTAGAHLEDWDLSGSLHKPLGHLERHRWCKFDKVIKVPVTRLDTWRAGIGGPQIDFIWLDVQGAEADVFEGGRETLLNTHYLYTEFNDYRKSLYEGDLNQQQTLAALGPAWEPVGIYEGYNLLCRNTEWNKHTAV